MSKGSLNTHARFFSGSNISFENLLLPSHAALVFSIFTFRPEHSPKSSKVPRQWESEVWVPSKRKKMSSAYWLSKNSSLLMVMPLIWLFCFIASARSSAQIIKRYGDRGSPCLTPLETEKELEQWPLYKMVLLIFLKGFNPPPYGLSEIKKTWRLRQESSILPNRMLFQNQLIAISPLAY